MAFVQNLYTYILVFDESQWPTKQVQDILDGMAEVRWWIRPLPNAIFLTSHLSAKQISDFLQTKLVPNTGSHIVIDCKTDYWGRLDKRVWKLITDPTSSGQE